MPATAQVTRVGDVTPPFVSAPVVDLTGQRVFIGNTTSGVGGIGTVNVINAGVLTAAQIVAGTGGLGSGFVNVTGAGSLIRLTGGATNNGLDIGSWGTGVVTVANGGAIQCASPSTCAFSDIGNAAGSTGTLAINGGSVTGLGAVGVASANLSAGFGTPGANTTGTLTISNGGTLTSSGFNYVASNNSNTGISTGNATVSGAGSSWTITRDLAGGGAQAQLAVGRSSNSNGTMTVSNGGTLNIVGSRATPATDNSLPILSIGLGGSATGTMTVTTGGAVRLSGDTGVINVGGGLTTAGGTGTLNITGGGTVAGTGDNGLTFVGIGRLNGTGTVNVSGAGSQLSVAGVGGQNSQGLDGVGGLVRVGTNSGGNGTLNVTNGGSVFISDNGFAASTGLMGMRLAVVNSTGTVTVAGVGSSIVVSSSAAGSATSPSIVVGNGGNAQMTIRDGATVSILGNGQRDFVVNNTATGTATFDMANGAQLVASRFAVADAGGNGTATINASTVNLDGVLFFNGVAQGAGVRVARGDGAVGVLNLQNGSVININNSVVSASVILGGTGALAGGTGTLNMSGASAINFTGAAASASLQVGGTLGTGFMTMAGGSTVNVGATGAATVGGNTGTSGTLTIGGASSISANVINIGGNSDTVAGGTGTATVTGLGSALIAGGGGTGLLAVGRGGDGSLTLTDQASASAISMSVGRNATGFGTLLVDNSVVNLSGQQTVATTNSGANLSIGIAGGTGGATIRNGSVVTISNPDALGASLNVGGRPDAPGATGNGVLNVAGSQINVLAAPGQATVRIGYDGNGIATLNGSTMNVGNTTATAADGALLIAAQPGSTGALTLNAGSIVNAGYVGVGTTTAGAGGAGTLMLNDSTLHAASFELGALGVLGGNGGRLSVDGDVVIAGKIAPGNSPGRLTIDCNLIMLPGSVLELDILSVGGTFLIDQLLIGNDSTFSLDALSIVFNFLGDTDPNAFLASGGFALDNFIRSLDLGTGATSGLSTAFAAGQTWGDIVDPARVSAMSSIYDLSDLQLRADGGISVVAVPVPEPETWALLAIGLLMTTTFARRSAAARRR